MAAAPHPTPRYVLQQTNSVNVEPLYGNISHDYRSLGDLPQYPAPFWRS